MQHSTEGIMSLLQINSIATDTKACESFTRQKMLEGSWHGLEINLTLARFGLPDHATCVEDKLGEDLPKLATV